MNAKTRQVSKCMASSPNFIPRGVLEQSHGPYVVLCGVVFAATQGGVPEVQGSSIGQQSDHAGQVFDKESVHDLLQEALEGGELGVPELAEQMLVQDHLLG